MVLVERVCHAAVSGERASRGGATHLGTISLRLTLAAGRYRLSQPASQSVSHAVSRRQRLYRPPTRTVLSLIARVDPTRPDLAAHTPQLRHYVQSCTAHGCTSTFSVFPGLYAGVIETSLLTATDTQSRFQDLAKELN